MSSTTTIVVALLSSGGLFAVIGAILNGLFTKKRLGAEATEIITKAASGVVERLEDELERRVKDMTDMKAEHHGIMMSMRQDQTATIDKLEREHAQEREQWKRVLQLHAAWDYIAIDKLATVGIELPPPPPILPALPRDGE